MHTTWEVLALGPAPEGLRDLPREGRDLPPGHGHRGEVQRGVPGGRRWARRDGVRRRVPVRLASIEDLEKGGGGEKVFSFDEQIS